MWALVESGSITKIYRNPEQVKIADIQYPSNIMTLWSDTELKAIGIYPVIEDNSNYKNPEYYTNTNQSFDYDSSANTVTASYGTATAKSLDDYTKTVGGVTTTYPGLKTQHKEDVDGQAYSLLLPSDWMVVRNAESSKAIPSDWLDYRVAVRTAAGNARDAIDAVSTVDELAALTITWPTQPSL